MNPLVRFYYLFTAHFPRLLPRTQSEIYHLKFILRQVFGIVDKPASWMTMVGQITSTPATKVRRPLSDFVHAIRRLDINAVAQDEKLRSLEILKAQLEVAVKKEAARDVAEQALAGLTHGSPQVA